MATGAEKSLRKASEMVRPRAAYRQILEQFATFPTPHALLEHARASTVVPVLPIVVMEGEVARILLPGDEGYEDA